MSEYTSSSPYLVKRKHQRTGKSRIIGFVWQKDGVWSYAFGRPSADSYITFGCADLEQGIARIEMHSNICQLNAY